MSAVDDYVAGALERAKSRPFHPYRDRLTYLCQEPERIRSSAMWDPRCIGCAIGARMMVGSNDQIVLGAKRNTGAVLRGDDRIEAVDRLIGLATRPTDLDRITEEAA